MKYLFLFVLIFAVTCHSCKHKDSVSFVSLSDLTFNSIFADSKKDSLHTYCLLGSGYFRAETTDNVDSLINDWLSRHPNADVIPVATHGPTLSDYPNSKMTYCWLVDNRDTINNYLVRAGCFEGGTMTIWKKYPGLIVHVNQSIYDKFVEQVRAAELYARQQRLGIWNKKEEDEY